MTLVDLSFNSGMELSNHLICNIRLNKIFHTLKISLVHIEDE